VTIETTAATYSQPVKLRIWQTVGLTYTHLFRNAWIYLGQAGLLFGVVLALGLLIGLVYGLAAGDAAIDTGPAELIAGGIGGVLFLIGLMAICVGGHRAVLLDEKPRLLGVFRIRRRELRYLGVFLLCLFVLIAPFVGIAFVIGMMGPTGDSGIAVFILLSFVILLWLLIVPLLFALAFPAIARRQALRKGITLGRGHRLRIVGLLIAAQLPLLLGAIPLGFLTVAMGEAIAEIFRTFLQFIQTLVLVTATSFAYETIAGPAADEVANIFD
jgi:hypothetical protein